MFGLKENDINTIVEVLQKYPEVTQAVVFGSRAKGNYKNGSDVDIAVKGAKATLYIAETISGILNEDTQIPYRFDVLSYNDLCNQDLKDHIDRVGVVFYQTKIS
ncbi:nucleotidyltransferase domain-containing protein [soil metagenome]